MPETSHHGIFGEKYTLVKQLPDDPEGAAWSEALRIAKEKGVSSSSIGTGETGNGLPKYRVPDKA